MEKEMKTENKIETAEFESLDEIAKETKELIPPMPNVCEVTADVAAVAQKENDLVSDEMWHGLINEALDNIRKDRLEAAELQTKFEDMAFNDGDASTSTKEAVVNLFKMRTDLSDKLAKLADLATRVKLKERDTFPKYLAVNQNNTINANRTAVTPEEKRRIIEQENKRLAK